MKKRSLVLRLTISFVVLVSIFSTYIALQRFVLEPLNRSKCAHNLLGIGQTILLYRNEHKGDLPPDLGTLAHDEDIAVQVFICPDSDTQAPSNLQPDQLVTWVNANADYTYLGTGLHLDSDSDHPADNVDHIVLAYEKESNHHGKGMNVLFGDGHVEWMTPEAAQRAIASAEAVKTTTKPMDDSVLPSSRP